MNLLKAIFVGVAQGMGITAGVHRLWSHKAYKAKLPLRALLAILYVSTGQVIKWLLNSVIYNRKLFCTCAKLFTQSCVNLTYYHCVIWIFYVKLMFITFKSKNNIICMCKNNIKIIQLWNVNSKKHEQNIIILNIELTYFKRLDFLLFFNNNYIIF